MQYIKDLESNSSTKIRKAAEIIFKNKHDGYSLHLIESLVKEIEKPKSWKTQCQLIKAIAATECTDALALLYDLIDRDYSSTILYRELGFAIFILENLKEHNLNIFYKSIEKGNEMQICGVCSGILFKKMIPSNDDIKNIISGVTPYTENEGLKITPRCYIAAVAYLWPKSEISEFLESCKNSTWSGLVEISTSSLQGIESKIKLI